MWDPMWGISILVDFIPMGYKLSCCSSLCSVLFKSFLGHCDFPRMKTVLIFFGHNFETTAIVLAWLAFKSLESLEKIVEASDG